MRLRLRSGEALKIQPAPLGMPFGVHIDLIASMANLEGFFLSQIWGSRRVWSPQLSPTSGEKGLSRTPAAFQTSAGDYVAEDNVKISIEFQKSALTKNANAALLCSVVSLGHGEMLGRRGLPLRPQRKSMAP